MSLFIDPKDQKILFPPRPKSRVNPTAIKTYMRRGYIGQRKFNGTHVVVNVTPERKVGILTRHGDSPKQFSLSVSHAKQILSLNLESGLEYWLQGELLNNKTTNPNYKGKIVFFDVLQAGRYLYGDPPLMKRIEMLANICRNPTELEPYHGIALATTKDIWMAETFTRNLVERYKEMIQYDEIEGLVLKKPKSCLDNFGQKEYDVNWMLRCRKPNKLYQF